MFMHAIVLYGQFMTFMQPYVTLYDLVLISCFLFEWWSTRVGWDFGFEFSFFVWILPRFVKSLENLGHHGSCFLCVEIPRNLRFYRVSFEDRSRLCNTLAKLENTNCHKWATWQKWKPSQHFSVFILGIKNQINLWHLLHLFSQTFSNNKFYWRSVSLLHTNIMRD